MRHRALHSIFMLIALAVATIVVVMRTQPRERFAYPASHDVIQLSALALAQVQPAPAQPPPARRPAMRPSREQRGELTHERAQHGQFPPEIIDRCLEVARDIDSDLGRELAQKRIRNPDEFDQMMQGEHVGRRLWAMAQLKQRDPDLYRHKISEVTQALQINRVAAQLHEAMSSSDQGKINALKEQLRGLLELQFALSLKARAEYLCRIEEQAKALRDEIDEDATNFRQIVDARMRRLLENPPATDPTAVLPAAHQAPAPNQPPPRPAP